MAKSRAVAVRSRVRRIYVTGRRRVGKMTIPIAIVAGLIPTFMEGKRYWDATYPASIGNKAANFGKGITAALTGYDVDSKSWSLGRAVGVPPLLGGVVAHLVANKLGINRMLAKARIPFIRI